ncbi:signal peptidase I [Streptacidiphilus cavernicola]|uniref:Signal peptidase I n=1 Tax=Streptacidiphilus cavernicola TaxID=3342716 RepID=A0ABV6W3V4_9ACTN
MSVRRLRPGGLLQGLGIAIGLIAMLGGFAVLAIQYRPYSVPTDSMQPTVQPGDTLLAHPVKGSAVGRGDIVIFNDPVWGNTDEVKRVIGVGGDKVACCDSKGRTTVDGIPLTEPYLAPGGMLTSATGFSVTVPAGRLFLMGDNRAVSLDSRSHLDVLDGTVPDSAVVARVEGRVWPLGRAGTIARTSALDAVPGPDATAHGPLAALVCAVVGGAALVLLTAAVGTVGGRLRKLRRQ